MALRGNRKVLLTVPQPNYIMQETKERGAVVVASGVDSSTSKNIVRTITGGKNIVESKPIGVLLDDVASIDKTKQLLNVHKSEVAHGDEVSIALEAVLETNMLVPDVTPAVGDVAYLWPSGLISNTAHTTSSGVKVGRFLTKKDSSGYATVHFRLDL